MITLVAWRNIWRNPVRSLIVAIAIALGLWAGIFMLSFNYGIIETRTRDIIQTQVSHIQLHHPQFERGGESKFHIQNGAEVLDKIKEMPFVKAISGRILIPAMLESSKGNFGVELIGVQPQEEAVITKLESRMVSGDYFKEGRSTGIIVGDKLAEKIGVKVIIEDGKESYNFRRRLVFRFQTASNEISSLRVRVVGVYETVNSMLEETQVFIQHKDIDHLLEIPGEFHEIALLMDQDKSHTKEKMKLIQAIPAVQNNGGVKVEGWMDIAPDVEFLSKSFETTTRIFMGVILLALAFGIINTMLMAVLERTRELGMLMSIGMNKARVFIMIMLETIFLTFIGAPIGMLIGWGMVNYFGKTGIDLSAFSQGTEQFGMSSFVYTELPTQSYIDITIMVIITAIISAIYPARKALKLKPAEAVRAI